jgi:DNA-binding MarR family transcriptional regulator
MSIDIEHQLATLQRRILRPLSRGGPDGRFDLVEYHVLSLVRAHNGSTVTEIARALSLVQGTTSELVDKLVRAEKLERQRDPDDSRRRRVLLTAKGLRRIHALRLHAATVLDNMPSDRRDALAEALQTALRATEHLEKT